MSAILIMCCSGHRESGGGHPPPPPPKDKLIFVSTSTQTSPEKVVSIRNVCDEPVEKTLTTSSGRPLRPMEHKIYTPGAKGTPGKLWETRGTPGKSQHLEQKALDDITNSVTPRSKWNAFDSPSSWQCAQKVDLTNVSALKFKDDEEEFFCSPRTFKARKRSVENLLSKVHSMAPDSPNRREPVLSYLRKEMTDNIKRKRLGRQWSAPAGNIAQAEAAAEIANAIKRSHGISLTLGEDQQCCYGVL